MFLKVVEMEKLNQLYGSFPSVGLLTLRQAIDAKDLEWAQAEVELLHNIPSLIDDPNLERHRYFWHIERGHYLDWLNAPGRDQARSRTRTYYAPLWAEMEPILHEAITTASR